MRTIKLTFLLFGVTLLLVLAAACASAQTPAPTPVPPTPTAIQPSTAAPANTEPSSEPTFVPSTAADSGITGASLFDLSCSQCHGLDAAGKTFEDDGNTISPPSLAWSDLSQMYALDTSRGTLEQQLTLAITKGQDETGDELNAMMPRWSSLSQEQRASNYTSSHARYATVMMAKAEPSRMMATRSRLPRWLGAIYPRCILPTQAAALWRSSLRQRSPKGWMNQATL
ncbi:MAG: hypothetical protein P8Z00_18440 [Anaerolineales bacterium]